MFPLEDFDTIGLIGYGEFGKVFQAGSHAMLGSGSNERTPDANIGITVATYQRKSQKKTWRPRPSQGSYHFISANHGQIFPELPILGRLEIGRHNRREVNDPTTSPGGGVPHRLHQVAQDGQGPKDI